MRLSPSRALCALFVACSLSSAAGRRRRTPSRSPAAIPSSKPSTRPRPPSSPSRCRDPRGGKDMVGTGVIVDERGYHRHQPPRRRRLQAPSRSACTTARSSPPRSLFAEARWDLAVLRIDADKKLPALPLVADRRPHGRRDGHRRRPSLRLHATRCRAASSAPWAARSTMPTRRRAHRPDPDRRQHQPGQLRRPAAQHQRRADRHQRRPARRRPGHRLRHQRRHGQRGAQQGAQRPADGRRQSWPGLRGKDARRDRRSPARRGRVLRRRSGRGKELKAGDEIRSVGTRTVVNAFDVERSLWDAKPGETVELQVERRGKSLVVALTLAASTGAGQSASAATDAQSVAAAPWPGSSVSASAKRSLARPREEASPREQEPRGLFSRFIVAGTLRVPSA